jgi:nucleotide-binding universal stress UspA family protein
METHMAQHGARPVIIVGTDGSPGSIEALRWALRQAQATGAEVRVLLAWEVATTLGNLSEMTEVDWADIARTAIDEAAAAEPGLTAPISTEAVPGHPSNILVEASKDADLLVVGCRGHGRVREMMLGSVSNHCTHHAHCPVVVVRSPAPAAQPG